jgi:hypothetical protein
MKVILALTVTLLAQCLFVFGSYEKSYKSGKHTYKNDYSRETYDKPKRTKVKEEFEFTYKQHKKSDIICVPLATASSYKLSRNEECAPYTLNINETFESISGFNTTKFLALVDFNPEIDFEKATNGTTICVPSLKYQYKLSGPCLSYIKQKGETFKTLSNGNLALQINLTNANPTDIEDFRAYGKENSDDQYEDYKKIYKNDKMKINDDKLYKKAFICVPLAIASKYKLRKDQECSPYVLNINETMVSISNSNLEAFIELLELNPRVNYETATNGTTICVPSLKFKYKLSGPCLAYQLKKGETFKSISNGDLSLYIDLKNSNPNGYGYNKKQSQVDMRDRKSVV